MLPEKPAFGCGFPFYAPILGVNIGRHGGTSDDRWASVHASGGMPTSLSCFLYSAATAAAGPRLSMYMYHQIGTGRENIAISIAFTASEAVVIETASKAVVTLDGTVLCS